MSNALEYGNGVAAIEAIIAADIADPSVDPRCVPVLMQHGHPVERAIVLFHGFTNCPRQFTRFGTLLFDGGFDVYIPRLPHHGLRDKLTTALAELTITELTDCATSAVAGVAALGSRTSVLGLSVGATIVAWLAQNSALDRAVAIAPFFSVAHVGSIFEPALAGALSLAPNLELWWDPRRKADIGPAHGYPRFPTHALARCLQLGAEVRESARSQPPQTPRTTLVLNAKDPAIDAAAARDVWRAWHAHGAPVDEYTFENLDTRHDIIEPQTYPAAAALVYPVLARLVAE